MKINLGAGPNWQHDGWHILDHKLQKNETYAYRFMEKTRFNKI